MTKGHLGQFYKMHCDLRLQNVLLNNMSISGQFFMLSVYSAFTHFLDSTLTKNFLRVLYVFWDILLFMSSFSAILLGDVIALKRPKFPKGTFSRRARFRDLQNQCGCTVATSD